MKCISKNKSPAAEVNVFKNSFHCKSILALKASMVGHAASGFHPGLTMELSWWQAEERLRSIPDVRKALQEEELGLSDAW